MMNRIVIVFAGLASTLVSAVAWADYEQPKAGFLYVSASAATLRETASKDGKSVGGAPRGARLVYRKVMVGDDGKPTWVHAEPPGGTAGWIAATDLSETRPTPLPPGKPLKLVDTGLGNAHPTASMTAAANGMDERAVKYGKAQNLELTVNQFLTLESEVERLYQDPHDDKGAYPEDRDNPVRKTHATNFRATLKDAK